MAKKNQDIADVHQGEIVTRAIRWLVYRGFETSSASLAETLGVSRATITNNKALAKVPSGFLYELDAKALRPHGASLQDFIGAGNPEGPEEATRLIITTIQRTAEFVEQILEVVTDLKEENKKLKEEVAKLSRLITKKSVS